MRRAHRAVLLIAPAILALTMTACSGGSAEGAAGTWGPDTDGQPQLVLAEDGSLSGTDGCNRLTGGWEQDGDTVSFGEVGSTRMACEGVDTWLSDLATATLDGDTLRVLDTAGVEIGTLDRS